MADEELGAMLCTYNIHTRYNVAMARKIGLESGPLKLP
jgi:hypothetical protein